MHRRLLPAHLGGPTRTDAGVSARPARIAAAGDSAKPVTWSIQIIDDPKAANVRRSIGSAVTASKCLPDGWFELSSRVNFDAGGLLKGTAFATKASVRLELVSVYRVDPSGNLRSFDMKVTPVDSSETLFTVHGRLHGGVMEVVSKPLPVLNQKLSFAYEPRSVVHDVLGPLDRLPGLHVGQRWDTRMVNPFTGQVEVVRVEVLRRDLIHWNGEPVSAFEVVHHSGPVTADLGPVRRGITPASKFRMLLHTNPTRERGECLGTRAGASEDM